jgi:protein required for attachment to host cells
MYAQCENDGRCGLAASLADLGDAFHAEVKSRIVTEIHKDLTKHSIAEIEKHRVG